MGWFRGFGVPKCRGSFVWFTLLVAISLSENGRGQELVVPIVLSGELPKYPQIAAQAMIQGTVTLTVTTDGETVVDAEVLRRAPMLDQAAVAAIKTWRFAPHRPTTFETNVKFQVSSPERCYARGENPRWISRLPFEVEVQASALNSCTIDPAVSTTPDFSVRTLQGVVKCDCPGYVPIGGAAVSVTPDVYVPRETTTSRDGRFNLSNVQPDRYFVTVGARGFQTEVFLISVSPSNDEVDANFLLKPLPARSEPPLPPLLRTEAWTVAAFPAAARAKGISGTVGLLVATDGVIGIIAGPPVLADAALETLRFWKPRSLEYAPFEVRFRYVLVDNDCGPNQNPIVDVKMPEVTITAKRVASCKQNGPRPITQ